MSKLLLKFIPTQVRITPKVTYQVLWVDSFPDSNQVGQCTYETKQIILKKNESPTETFKSFIHECLHSLSFETKGLNLTENQVQQLEDSLFRFLKLNKILDLLLKLL